MTARYDDPLEAYDSLLDSYDGQPIPDQARLSRLSAFTRITTPRVFASITQQRLYARVADGH